jgi:hypothetical protein
MVAVAAAVASTAEAADIGNHQRYKISGLREHSQPFFFVAFSINAPPTPSFRPKLLTASS